MQLEDKLAELAPFLEVGLLAREIVEFAFGNLSRDEYKYIIKKLQRLCYSEHLKILIPRFLGYYKKSKIYGSLFGSKLPITRVYYELRNLDKVPLGIKILDLLAENGGLSKTKINAHFNMHTEKNLKDLVHGELICNVDGFYRLSYLGKMLYSVDAKIWNELRKQSWYKQLY